MSQSPFAHLFATEIEGHRAVVARMDAMQTDFETLCKNAIEALENGGKLLFFGNGGSAADAQHLATELTVRFRVNRRALGAIALTTDTSALTAIGNDFGFDDLFSRQIEALGRPGDMAIGISTSGKSPNVIAGLRQARSMGVTCVALTGAAGLVEDGLADLTLAVPSPDTARIQEMHITLGHMLCAALDQHFS